MAKFFERLRKGQDPKEAITSDLFNSIFDRIERLWDGENWTAGPGLLKKGTSISLNKRPVRSGGSSSLVHPFQVAVEGESLVVRSGKVNNITPTIGGVQMGPEGTLAAPTAGTHRVVARVSYTYADSAFPSAAEILMVASGVALTPDDVVIADVIATLAGEETTISLGIQQSITTSIGARRTTATEVEGFRSSFFWAL